MKRYETHQTIATLWKQIDVYTNVQTVSRNFILNDTGKSDITIQSELL